MFIEFYNTEGAPFTVNLLQVRSFRPQGNRDNGNTIIVLSDTGTAIANTPYDVVKQQIQAMTRG